MIPYLKKAVIVPLCVVMFSFSSCGIISENSKTAISQDKICQETCEEVFEYIKDHDTENLIELFSEESAEKHDLEKEIEEMYDFIDGNLDSYESISDPATGESVRDGKIVRLNGSPWIKGVKTTTGHEYIILVEIVLIYEDKNYEGVAQIGINDVNTEERLGIGEPFVY